MARKLIHCIANEAGKLQCDNPTCGHVLPEALEFNEGLIGHPCPKCGSDMLTRKDYEGQMRIAAVVDFLNRWFSWLPWATEEPPKGPSIAARVANGKLELKPGSGVRPLTGNYRYSIKDEIEDGMGELYPINEWLDMVECGGFVDDDGFGNPVLNEHSDEDIFVYPSDELSEVPRDATHVMWYNR